MQVAGHSRHKIRDCKTACILTFEWPSNVISVILNYPDQSPLYIRFILRTSLCHFYSHQSHCHGRFSATIRPLHTFYIYFSDFIRLQINAFVLQPLYFYYLYASYAERWIHCFCFVPVCVHVCMYIRAEAKQVAQLSQRDRAAGWVIFRQKWKTGTERQYFADIIGLCSTIVT